MEMNMDKNGDKTSSKNFELTIYDEDARQKWQYQQHEQIKKQELFKMKSFMVAGLVFAFLVFLVALFYDIKWLKAVSEAALIGGLADWFAVAALFKRPLGFPFHTAIIPNNKDKIAKNLAIFVRAEFLNRRNLKELDFIKNYNTKKFIYNFLHSKEAHFNIESLFVAVEEKILPYIYKKLRESKSLSGTLNISNVDFATIFAKTLLAFKQSNKDALILDGILNSLEEKLNKYEPEIKKKVAIGWGAKFLAFLTSYDSYLIDGIKSYLQRCKQEGSSEREKLLKDIDNVIDKLLLDDESKAQFNQNFIALTDSKTLANMIDAIILSIENDKGFNTLLKRSFGDMLEEMIKDDRRVAAFDEWLKKFVINLLSNKSELISSYIEKTINSWDSKTISRKIELEIGKDLQYIRLNGMVVGALIGLIIYFITTFVQNL